MKKNDFEGHYNVLKELVVLRQVSTKKPKTEALDRITYAFICYISTGKNEYLDTIMYAMVDCEHPINLPTMLINHIEDYIDTLLVWDLELDSL